ncbi:LysE family translocator [Saccharicrinis aurantiacus]|uniref:LysE family translocator n=1 Tax=Saccharicrinis aurantiacus TaxID=1849719 RepID=UPI000838DD70|nr:LysE family transporter [Saccharicrinis aurantiacus]
MSLNFLSDGIIVGFLASVSLGPIGVLCIQRTLNKGKLSGFISGLGAVVSDTIYAIIASFSISYILGFVTKYELFIQIFGALVLIGLGISIFMSNPAVELRKQKKVKSSLFQDFISTFFLTISNPLAIGLFLAWFAFFEVVKEDGGLPEHVMLIGGVFLGATIWWFMLTSVINLFRSKINLRRLWWLNKIAGAAIVVLVIVAFSVFMMNKA